MTPRWRNSFLTTSGIFGVAAIIGASIGAVVEWSAADAWPPFDVISSGAAKGIEVTAVLLAFVAFSQAYALESHMNHVLQEGQRTFDQLRRLGETVSTRGLGVFPHHLYDISRMIWRAHGGDSIEIVADCVDYGSFFDPEGHKKLQSALAGTTDKKGLTVRIFAYGIHPISRSAAIGLDDLSNPLKSAALCALLDQYRHALRDDGTFMKMLAAYSTDASRFHDWLERGSDFRDSPSDLSQRLQTCQEWIGERASDLEKQPLETLLCFREYYFEESLRGPTIQVNRINAPAPAVSFWKVDQREVIFMFGNVAGYAAPAFYSQDPAILNVMVPPRSSA